MANSKIAPAELLFFLEQEGMGPYTGVPDSTLAPLFTGLKADNGKDYFASTSEGEAMGIAAGWALAGKLPVVLMQNSGLGNAVNPLTSLHQIFRLPALMIIGWRGQPGRGTDAVEHDMMGERTLPMLETLNIRFEVAEAESNGWRKQLPDLLAHMRDKMEPVAFVVPRGVLSREPAQSDKVQGIRGRNEDSQMFDSNTEITFDETLDPRTALEEITKALGEGALIVSTTGFISRFLYEQEDTSNRFYMVGSMGCAAAIGFGLATQCPSRKVAVIDGDGALLMKLGVMATIGHYQPRNLLHIVFDNTCYASTGGQTCASSTVDFVNLAGAAGYRWGRKAGTKMIAEACRAYANRLEGPGILHVRVSSDEHPSQRPSQSPLQLRDRFMAEVGRSVQ